MDYNEFCRTYGYDKVSEQEWDEWHNSLPSYSKLEIEYIRVNGRLGDGGCEPGVNTLNGCLVLFIFFSFMAVMASQIS